MILSSKREAKNKQFEDLLSSTKRILETKNKADPAYFFKRSPTDFEKDVHAAMEKAAVGTPFEGNIKLVSGHRFPDIIDDEYYGVEVKTAKTNWKSTGNSVLESTRVDKIEVIYLFFGRLTKPAAFKFRKYEECLHEVAVTHSPRYLIDMDLASGKSIFDKMKVSYDELRKLDKPIKPFISYYRETAKKGEEPWWMEGTDLEEETIISPTVSLWSNLSHERQEALRIEAMALFPEVLGKSSIKYQNLSLWLVTRKGIVDASLRDKFTAGGQVSINLGRVKYSNLPKIFFHLNQDIEKVLKNVSKLPIEDVIHYWKPKKSFKKNEVIKKWCELAIDCSKGNLNGNKKFIFHLLASYVEKKHHPEVLKDGIKRYKL